MISGGRYHLLMTWLDKHRYYSWRLAFCSLCILAICAFEFSSVPASENIIFFVVFLGLLKLNACVLVKEMSLMCLDLDTTFGENKEAIEPLLLKDGTTIWSLGTLRANPKSQSFTWHSPSTRMLAGLMSLCIMFAEWRKLRAQRALYAIISTC